MGDGDVLFSLGHLHNRSALGIPATVRQLARYDVFWRDYRSAPSKELLARMRDELRARGLHDIDPRSYPQLYGSLRALDDEVQLLPAVTDDLVGVFRCLDASSKSLSGQWVSIQPSLQEGRVLFGIVYDSHTPERCLARLERDLLAMMIERCAGNADRFLQKIALVGWALSVTDVLVDEFPMQCAELLGAQPTRYPLLNSVWAAKRLVYFLCPSSPPSKSRTSSWTWWWCVVVGQPRLDCSPVRDIGLR